MTEASPVSLWIPPIRGWRNAVTLLIKCSGIGVVLGIIAAIGLHLLMFLYIYYHIAYDKFLPGGERALSSQVQLFRPSGRVVSICDKDGFALIQGNVMRLSYAPGSGKNAVLVAHTLDTEEKEAKEKARAEAPANPSASPQTPQPSEPQPRLHLSRVDLLTCEVTSLPDPDGKIAASLEPIRDWL